eukprot:CAMPEP_0116129642 /NCGR_PEP_ID=MMETSP0329-20121206/8028_1 /TAXON_ID=697910 /ORGANISM="Pseudo-nitzschia arenysensis, Strain B593" /LENGTH=302 /DNA_ID=CAMNT_0003623913 /DNA_START=9 /DNA_END=920 /DNA_ORIENTATION=-
MIPIRVSMSGMLILGVFLKILHHLFHSSIYASLLVGSNNPQNGLGFQWSSHLSMCVLHSATCAASFLNVTSHAAVALGVLNDTYVLSILVGVGFDVLTRVLQLVWWIKMTANLTSESTEKESTTSLFLLLLVIFYVYHMIIHVRALFLNKSLSRLKTVLMGALNNLRGIPGEAYLDHLFAYTDLGTHLFALWLSFLLLQAEGAIFLAVGCLGLLAGISYVILSQIPFSESSDKELAFMIKVVGTTEEATTITCSCRACKTRQERLDSNSPVSFTVGARDGICQLWLASFGQLTEHLALATKP